MIDIKAQYSIEFILVFAFSLIVIIPVINYLHDEYSKNKGSLDASQAKQVLDTMSIAIQNAYYAGYPSRTTLTLYFPAGIINIQNTTVEVGGVKKSELVFDIDAGSSQNSIVSVFPFEVWNNITGMEGKRNILIKAEKGGYVNITEGE